MTALRCKRPGFRCVRGHVDPERCPCPYASLEPVELELTHTNPPREEEKPGKQPFLTFHTL
jgi:hypothetical protein